MSWFKDLFKNKEPVQQSPAKHFLDLSHHNEKVDLMKLKNQELVILKATQGKRYIDEKFASRWIGLKACGIRRGAYHFYQCNLGDPIVQADHFLSTIGDTKPDDILAFDFETCGIKGMIQNMDDLINHKPNALIFMRYIKQKTGITPWFYTYNEVIRLCSFEKEFTEFPLWYARYTSIEPSQKQGPWESMIGWQYYDKGKVDGISGDVDMNWLKGDI